MTDDEREAQIRQIIEELPDPEGCGESQLNFVLRRLDEARTEIARLTAPPSVSAVEAIRSVLSPYFATDGEEDGPEADRIATAVEGILRDGGRLIERREAAALTAFATAILHGDEKHRRWLKSAAGAFIAGRPLPAPTVTAPGASAMEAARTALDEGYFKPLHLEWALADKEHLLPTIARLIEQREAVARAKAIEDAAKAIEVHWWSERQLEATRDCLDLSDVQESIRALATPAAIDGR
jgi:hypothetical protein